MDILLVPKIDHSVKTLSTNYQLISYDEFFSSRKKYKVIYFYFFPKQVDIDLLYKLIDSKSDIYLIFDSLSDSDTLFMHEDNAYFFTLLKLIKKSKHLFFLDQYTYKRYYHYYGHCTDSYSMINTINDVTHLQPLLSCKNSFSLANKKLALVKIDGGLGDFFLAFPALIYILRRYPGATLFCSYSIYELLKKSDFDYNLLPLNTILDTRLDEFDSVINFNNIAVHSYPTKDSFINLSYPTFQTINTHISHHYFYGIMRLNLPLNDFPISYIQLPLSKKLSYCTIHMGAGDPNKSWPQIKFKQLIELILKKFPTLKIKLIKGPNDPEFISEMSSLLSHSRIELLPALSLAKLAKHIKQGRFHIGNDSGISHLAGAINHPNIAIFGPTGPGSWRPLGDHSLTLWNTHNVCNVHCDHIIMNNCSHKICLNSILPSSVLEGVDMLMNKDIE